VALAGEPRDGNHALVERFLGRPGVASFRQRFAVDIDWLEQRLSPQGYLGIHLTIGILLLLAAAATFGGSIQALGTRDFFVAADLQVARWFENHAAAGANTVMTLTAHLSSVVWLGAIAALAAAALIWQRKKYRVLVLLLAGPVGVGLDFLLKQIFARDRPVFGEEFAGRGSGLLHGDMLSATVVYGALTYILIRGVRQWRYRALFILLTILVLFVIALSSLYLGGYFLSDVLAAMIEGAVWLFFCISGVEIVRWRAETQRPLPLS